MAPAIDVDTDRDFQERFWIVVRVGWVAMAVLCLVALLGLTGSGGPYSSQTIQAGPVRIDFPAIARWQASDTLTVHVASQSERTTVLIPAAFGDIFTIDSISPQARSVTATPEGELFEFAVKPGGKATIDFSVRPVRPVWRSQLGPFKVDGASSPPTTLTVLP
ncbi:hypothetical protein D6851_17050 [Altericroceibacterium spongiae]|uniref:Uncharacterized protein n=1 Tax=Altericroceibacterium spongiae TaxID=2320269 RepID=A0A420E9H4_9SPHN|nr:hypothetical protein [Altericroceibacterium spongiae]RKF15984.1 hypothetical protein D6851_17050 [Altericroceibacterium spongiae]